MRARFGAVTAVLSVALIGLGTGISLPAASAAEAPGITYPGDPVAEAKLVVSEDQHLIDVQTLMGTALRQGSAGLKPYRLAVGPIPTLVLTARAAPYTIDELLTIAPRTLTRGDDGSYLLSENLMIAQGAVLKIADKAGLVLKLRSDPTGFVSIIAAGGSLVVEGAPNLPILVQSFDSSTGAADTTTADGRAYLRVYGGRVVLTNAEFDDLGFWSGVTGGVSLTGVGTTTDSLTGAAQETDNPGPTGDAQGGPKATLNGQLLPADGGLDTLSLGVDEQDLGYSTGLIQDVTFTRNAFGLFVSNSDRVEIQSSTIEQSLVDGLVFHRNVTNSSVTSTKSLGNARDGFRITRGTSGVSFDRIDASNNGRNGISIEGGPLAAGPTATGMATTVFGNNQVVSSTSSANGRYGIEIVGGDKVTISNNTVRNNVMGVVATNGVTELVVKNNEIRDSQIQGIALRDSGTDAVVTGNTVAGADIGIYARDAGGNFDSNRISDAHIHALSLVGATGNSLVTNNSAAGSGPSAFDVVRTSDSIVRANDSDAWHGTKPLSVTLRGIFQPLTVVWILLALIIAISAISRASRRRGIRDPFLNQRPMSSLTRGIIPRDELRGTP